MGFSRFLQWESLAEPRRGVPPRSSRSYKLQFILTSLAVCTRVWFHAIPPPPNSLYSCIIPGLRRHHGEAEPAPLAQFRAVLSHVRIHACHPSRENGSFMPTLWPHLLPHPSL